MTPRSRRRPGHVEINISTQRQLLPKPRGNGDLPLRGDLYHLSLRHTSHRKNSINILSQDIGHHGISADPSSHTFTLRF